jgi:hypothetical protein
MKRSIDKNMPVLSISQNDIVYIVTENIEQENDVLFFEGKFEGTGPDEDGWDFTILTLFTGNYDGNRILFDQDFNSDQIFNTCQEALDYIIKNRFFKSYRDIIKEAITMTRYTE